MLKKFRIVLMYVLIAMFICNYQLISYSANKLSNTIAWEQQNTVLENDVNCNIPMTNQTSESQPVSPCAIDSENNCLENCNTHGPGRESGGTTLLSVGCRNYVTRTNPYGLTIPYWIDMDSINSIIPNEYHIELLLSDIRQQAGMWNEITMYDGSNMKVNFYEVTSDVRPTQVDGRRVLVIRIEDLSSRGINGYFQMSDTEYKIALSYVYGTAPRPGREIDTPMHEMGHVLGLLDLEASGTGISYGTHKVLMAYDRNTTSSTLKKSIKYQDIQGVAVANGLHTNHSYYRYVQQGNTYKHICFYCDRIDSSSTIISGSQPVQNAQNCSHNYQQFVSSGDVDWYKCTKCYKVIEQEYYQINYENMEFLGQEAIVYGIADDFIVKEKYKTGEMYNVHGASAMWPAGSPYSPQLVFLGWYTDMNFTTLAPQITSSTTGNVTYYAKWRYDINYIDNSGFSGITDANPLNQQFTNITLGLNSNNLYNELLNIGIKNITINFKMRSMGTGTQYVYLYSTSGTRLATKSFTGTSGYTVKSYQFTLPLTTVGVAENIHIRYKAATGKTWGADKIYIESAGVVQASDLNITDNEFTWRYLDPL